MPKPLACAELAPEPLPPAGLVAGQTPGPEVVRRQRFLQRLGGEVGGKHTVEDAAARQRLREARGVAHQKRAWPIRPPRRRERQQPEDWITDRSHETRRDAR